MRSELITERIKVGSTVLCLRDELRDGHRRRVFKKGHAQAFTVKQEGDVDGVEQKYWRIRPLRVDETGDGGEK
eukprot:2885296-Prymnesium_polylepis.1